VDVTRTAPAAAAAHLAAAVEGVVDDALAAGLPGTAVSVAVHHPAGPDVHLLRGTVAAGGEPLTADHLFDLASLTKVFVAVAALSLVQDGVVALDAPVREVLPVGSGEGADRITLRHLLTHTAGLAPSSAAWQNETDPGRLLADVLASPLEAPPGRHTYSCLGYIATGRLLETVTGSRLDTLVRERVLAPLGAATARFGPVDPAVAVATETQPHRGDVRGAVHDELAHALARPVGNAGLFGTADDVLALGQMLLARGEGRVGRVLEPVTADLLLHAAVGPDPGGSGDPGGPAYGQAIGCRIADPAFMGTVRGIGHTGFTGTSLVVDPLRGTVAVLLTNRVHPTREGTDVNPLRRAVAEAVAAAARPSGGA
jgi:CubicO group peptidase (beta-lactamase class C family)